MEAKANAAPARSAMKQETRNRLKILFKTHFLLFSERTAKSYISEVIVAF
jgi:hypothetical protein